MQQQGRNRAVRRVATQRVSYFCFTCLLCKVEALEIFTPTSLAPRHSRLCVQITVRFVISDQVKMHTINVRSESTQCLNDSKQLLLCDVIDFLGRDHVPRPEGNRPT